MLGSYSYVWETCVETSFPCGSFRRKMTTLCLWRGHSDNGGMSDIFSWTSEGHEADKLPSEISQDGHIPSGQREIIQKSFVNKCFQRQLLQVSEEVNWEWEIPPVSRLRKRNSVTWTLCQFEWVHLESSVASRFRGPDGAGGTRFQCRLCPGSHSLSFCGPQCPPL